MRVVTIIIKMYNMLNITNIKQLLLEQDSICVWVRVQHVGPRLQFYHITTITEILHEKHGL
jgi:hypothetical protein